MPHDVLYNISASLKDISKALGAINTNLFSIACSLKEIKNQKTPRCDIDTSLSEIAWATDPEKRDDVVWFENEHHIDEEKK